MSQGVTQFGEKGCGLLWKEENEEVIKKKGLRKSASCL